MPIIQSLLDTDFYKFTMGHWVFKRYLTSRCVTLRIARHGCSWRSISVKRNCVASSITCALRVTPSELHYLRGTNEYGDGIFSEDYLQFLKELRLPPYALERVDGTYRLRFFRQMVRGHLLGDAGAVNHQRVVLSYLHGAPERL